MKIEKQTKKKLLLEIEPEEARLLLFAICEEARKRSNTWRKLEPSVAEELLYHAYMSDTSRHMSSLLRKAVNQYKRWDIL